MPSTFTDHHDEFRFVVQFFGHARADDEVTMSNQGAGSTEEDQRIGRLEVTAFFGVVVGVVSEANDLPRRRHERSKPHGRKRYPLASLSLNGFGSRSGDVETSDERIAQIGRY